MMTNYDRAIKTSYNRIHQYRRLNGLMPDGTVTVWLTQRLCSALVPNLINWLQKNLPGKGMANDEENHSFAQQSANLAHRNSSTETSVVPAPDDHKSWLAFSISIRSSAQAISITFADLEEKENIELRMGAEQLRQWLTIIYKNYHTASWPDHIWPEWIREHTSTEIPTYHPIH